MHSFRVIFSKNYVVVLVLILVPLLIMGAFVPIILSVPQLPDWALLLSVALILAGSIAAVVFMAKQWTQVDAEAVMDGQGIRVKLLRRTPFYRQREYGSTWEGTENVSSNLDTRNGRRFYTIRFRHPAVSFALATEDAAGENTETPFGEVLLGYVQQYNEAHGSQAGGAIRQQGFYDSWWAKGLTGLTFLAFAGIIIMKMFCPERLSLWRVLQVGSFGGLWLSAYYVNRRHPKQ